MRNLGILDKMATSFINPVQYFLQLGNDKVAMNEMIGSKIQLQWTGRIFCTICGKKIRKPYGEGLCWDCFSGSAENAECILRPELCEAHLGKGRNPEWEGKNHNTPHYVYLALTDAAKVGVTRGTQIPTRWIDQGANKGIIVAETPYRQLAGFIEVVLKDYFTDKTNWQKMLRNEVNEEIDLLDEKKRLISLLPEEYRKYEYTGNEVVELIYPVTKYPQKVTSISFEKTKTIDSVLQGIRGQYLIFEGGNVFNVRRNSGYEVELVSELAN